MSYANVRTPHTYFVHLQENLLRIGWFSRTISPFSLWLLAHLQAILTFLVFVFSSFFFALILWHVKLNAPCPSHSVPPYFLYALHAGVFLSVCLTCLLLHFSMVFLGIYFAIFPGNGRLLWIFMAQRQRQEELIV